jgi:hypothetical protein
LIIYKSLTFFFILFINSQWRLNPCHNNHHRTRLRSLTRTKSKSSRSHSFSRKRQTKSSKVRFHPFLWIMQWMRPPLTIATLSLVAPSLLFPFLAFSQEASYRPLTIWGQGEGRRGFRRISKQRLSKKQGLSWDLKL